MKSGLCPIVLQRTARLLTLAMVLAVGCVFDWSHEAQAQQVQQGPQMSKERNASHDSSGKSVHADTSF